MKRKTLSLSVSDDLVVIVKAPRFVLKSTIDAFVRKNEKWIEEAIIRKREKCDFYSDADISKLYEKGKKYLDRRIPYFSDLTGFVPSHVGITKAKTRFGSCSGKNRLNFSVYLFAYPDNAVDYVILHELCHIKHKNHSKLFYSEIEKYMPEYKTYKALLKNAPYNEKNS